MARTYEVGERVKVLIQHTNTIHDKEWVWDDYYAGTIITYHEFPDRETGEPVWLYKVSVDGVGDTKVARELPDGSLEIMTTYIEEMGTR